MSGTILIFQAKPKVNRDEMIAEARATYESVFPDVPPIDTAPSEYCAPESDPA